MKKATLGFLVVICLFTLNASAQVTKTLESTRTFVITDSTQYIGKYKYEGMPFEYMEISLKESKLYYSGGEYSGFLTPLKDKKDAFDADGQAVFTFLRNGQNKITDLQIDYQGQTYSGKRE
jgi:cytochrome c